MHITVHIVILLLNLTSKPNHLQIRRGTSIRLANNSVLEIAGLKFVFLINQDLIEAIRNEASRQYQNS